METRKISLACFVGGVAFGSVAYFFAPQLRWLGLFVGFACGYMSYEFDRSIKPGAIYAGVRSAVRGCYSVLSVIYEDLKMWSSEPHPFTYISLLVSTMICYKWPFPILMEGITEPGTLLVVIIPILLVLPAVLIAQLVSLPIVIIAYIGARVSEKCYWWPPLVPALTDAQYEEEVQQLESSGLQRESLNYANVARWFVKGVIVVVVFFVWTVWKYLCIAVWVALRSVGRFMWCQFVKVHTRKRLLCGIDGVLGGFTSYHFLGVWAVSVGEMVLAVFFGGILGAVIGILHWRGASKLLFR